jgi:hypothetical protein
MKRLPRHPIPNRVGSSAVNTISSMDRRGRQRTNGLDRAQHADSSIETSRVWNGVDMRPGSDGRKVRVGATPARERIADHVLANGEPGLFAKPLHERPSAEIGRRKDHARDYRRRRLRDLGQRVKFGGQPRPINLEIHCA